jgi:uncharacterized spore protein YtfJ
MDVQQVLSGAQDAMTARRVFGDPVELGGVTIIPVARVRGGGGGGANQGDRGGVGFGINARPAGVYVVSRGTVVWRPAIDVNRIILGGQLVAVAAIWALRPLLFRWLSPRHATPPPL